MYRNLHFKLPNINVTFDVNLRGRRNIISGGSAKGKSLFFDSLRTARNTNIALRRIIFPGIDPNIEFFNYDSIARFLGEDGDCDEAANYILSEINNLRKENSYLFIMDNADIYMNGNNDLVKFVNRDNANQYLIFSRAYNNLRTDFEQRGEMCVENGVVYIKYNERGQ